MRGRSISAPALVRVLGLDAVLRGLATLLSCNENRNITQQCEQQAADTAEDSSARQNKWSVAYVPMEVKRISEVTVSKTALLKKNGPNNDGPRQV